MAMTMWHVDHNNVQIIMDDNFEIGDILRFTTNNKVPPFHYAVYIGDGNIVHFNNPRDTNIFDIKY